MTRIFAGWVVLLMFLFAGCAQVPTGTLDSDRLHNAIAMDDVGFVEDSVRSGKLGVNDRVITPGYREGAPLIVIAGRYASLRVLRYLIAARAEINAITVPTGETALMLASYFNPDDTDAGRGSHERYEQAVRMLVDAGASLENAPNYYTPLAYAAYQGHNRIVRYLIERGARVDGGADGGVAYVNTPLMMAAIQGHADTAIWLLRAGANPKVRIHMGHTATELAQKHNHGSVIAALRCAENLAPGEPFSLRCR